MKAGIAVVLRWVLATTLLLGFGAVPGIAADMSREQALRQLGSKRVEARRLAVERLGLTGRMEDTRTLARMLFDDDEEVRALAEAAMWRVWSRSGDPRADALYRKGVSQMNGADAEGAVATFTELIRFKPDFAEAWNKRATVLYFLGRYTESMADCDEVLKRNPQHFGALSGYGQNYAKLEKFEKALEYFERALEVNPNMQGVAMNIVGLRRLIQDRAGKAI